MPLERAHCRVLTNFLDARAGACGVRASIGFGLCRYVAADREFSVVLTTHSITGSAVGSAIGGPDCPAVLSCGVEGDMSILLTVPSASRRAMISKLGTIVGVFVFLCGCPWVANEALAG